MAAITGNYSAPTKGIRSWVVDWLHSTGRNWTTPRKHLSEQLKYIRKAHGTKDASEFRDYLLWLGVYPVKRRNITD